MAKFKIKKWPGPNTGPIIPQKTLCLKLGKKRIRANENTIRAIQKVKGGEIIDEQTK